MKGQQKNQQRDLEDIGALVSRRHVSPSGVRVNAIAAGAVPEPRRIPPPSLPAGPPRGPPEPVRAPRAAGAHS